MQKRRGKMAIAICLLVLVVLASTYFSARRGLEKELKSAEEAFLLGTDGSGYSIYTDLQSRAALAHNLRTVALRYLSAEDIRLRDLDAAANRLEGETDPEKAYSANEALTQAADKVSQALGELDISDTDENYRMGIMADLNSYNFTIAHDGYNDYVSEVNERLNRFPARFLRRITFTGEAQYFR